MAHAKISVSIEGWHTKWLLSSLTLHQSYNDHHVFELSALVPAPSRGKAALTQESLISILGQTAHITITREDKHGGKCSFEGFVDQVVPVWHERACQLRITGYSKTMYMDCGPGFRTFCERQVSEIAKKLTGRYGLPLMLRNVRGVASFSVQTQETDYRYLCRLADAYGNVFSFDGTQLYFGSLSHENSEKFTLRYEEDIKQVTLSLNISPLNFNLSAYHIESGQILKQPCKNQCSHSSGLAAEVVQRSYNTYPAPSIHPFNAVTGQPELKSKAAHLLTKQAHELLRISGITNIPGLKIGSRISITGSGEIFARDEYVVVEVHHVVQNDRAYHNSFTAVPSGYPFPLRMQNSRNPVCGPVMAVVKDHRDPEQLGRVRVQFIGDEEQTLSPWLRVLTAYTGFGGMYFLPEKDDRVLVFAEDMNIEKSPFVLPAFYQGLAPARQWYDPENKKKGFTTEKTAFTIDDRSGKLCIQAEEIEIVSRKKMKIDGGRELQQQAQVVESRAGQDMNLDGGAHLTLKAARIDLNP